MQGGQSSALLLLGWSLLLWICVGSWVQAAAARGCQGPPLTLRCIGSSCRAVFSSWDASPDVAPSVLPREICRVRCCSRKVRRAQVRGLRLPARVRAPRAGSRHVSPRAHRNPGATAGTCSSPGPSRPPLLLPVRTTVRVSAPPGCFYCIFLALWWFSPMLQLTDESSRRTWKQNFHSL